MPRNESIKRTLSVIVGICLVCSLAVSTAAVLLKPVQDQNRRLDRIVNILAAADLSVSGSEALMVYNARIEPVLIELASGEQVDQARFDEVLNIEKFSARALVDDPRYSRTIPAAADLAGIKRMPCFMVVYRLMEGEAINRYILPVYGKGLWSTIRGFLALKPDLTTVADITFYEHGETPGLGGEITNPRWQRQWRGKQIFDRLGEVRLALVKGGVSSGDPEARFKVDALAGATLTSRGVEHLVRFWLGEEGYGPYLACLRGRR